MLQFMLQPLLVASGGTPAGATIPALVKMCRFLKRTADTAVSLCVLRPGIQAYLQFTTSQAVQHCSLSDLGCSGLLLMWRGHGHGCLYELSCEVCTVACHGSANMSTQAP